VLEAMLEGAAEGLLEGMPDGLPEGMLEGLPEGMLEGVLEAMLEGLGVLLAALEADPTGALEAIAGAELASAAAVVWLIAAGVSMVVGSLPLQAPMGAVNPRTTIDAKRMGRSLAYLRPWEALRCQTRLKRHKRRVGAVIAIKPPFMADSPWRFECR
jgi:hypothetical protein